MTTPQTIPSIPYIAASGGAGSVPAWGRPDLLVAAPGGIANLTPASSVYSAGNTVSLVAQQDIQQLAQGNLAMASRNGFVAYTYGKVGDAAKPGQETGIRVHGASGNVNLQSQSGQTRLTADKEVSVSSTDGMVRITAPKSILMTAGGAAIDLQAGSITLKGPGKVEFKAGMKVLEGAASASQSLKMKTAGKLERFNEAFQIKDEKTGQPLPFLDYRIEREDGSTVLGRTDAEGKTERIRAGTAETIKLFIID